MSSFSGSEAAANIRLPAFDKSSMFVSNEDRTTNRTSEPNEPSIIRIHDKQRSFSLACDKADDANWIAYSEIRPRISELDFVNASRNSPKNPIIRLPLSLKESSVLGRRISSWEKTALATSSLLETVRKSVNVLAKSAVSIVTGCFEQDFGCRANPQNICNLCLNNVSGFQGNYFPSKKIGQHFKVSCCHKGCI